MSKVRNTGNRLLISLSLTTLIGDRTLELRRQTPVFRTLSIGDSPLDPPVAAAPAPAPAAPLFPPAAARSVRPSHRLACMGDERLNCAPLWHYG